MTKPRTWQSRLAEPERTGACRKSKICSECGNLSHRVRGPRCQKCKRLYAPEPSSRSEVLKWATKSSMWDRCV